MDAPLTLLSVSVSGVAAILITIQHRGPHSAHSLAAGAKGEWQTQLPEADWGKYNFPGIVPPPFTPHLLLFLFTALQKHTVTRLCPQTRRRTWGTHQSAFGFDEGSVLAVHLVVQAAGVAQVVSSVVTSPQRRGGGPTVHTLTAL